MKMKKRFESVGQWLKKAGSWIDTNLPIITKILNLIEKALKYKH